MRRDELYLRDILEASENIAKDIAGMQRRDFTVNRTVRDAVVRNLTVIGEACARLSPSLKKSHADVPWADVVAFRNILVHAYFGVDWDIVWHAASIQAPDLSRRTTRILDSELNQPLPPE